VKVPLEDAVRKVFASEITHGPTAVVILKTWLQRRQKDGGF